MAIYVEEFLYRGRAPDAADPPAWHLQLTSVGTDDFGQPIRSTRVLSMQQAEEAGWALPEIIAEINVELMREHEALKVVHAELVSVATETASTPESEEERRAAAAEHPLLAG